MKLLIDAQLPPILAEWLLAQGLAAEHLADLKSALAGDATVIEIGR